MSRPPQLRYNLRWIDNTFSSRSLTESLLSPERDAGTLTAKDYDLATTFLPASHRYYPRGYAIAAGTASFAFARHKAWSRPRQAVVTITAYFLGFAIGQATRISLHLRFLTHLERFDGFSEALNNVYTRMGVTMPQGPTLLVTPIPGGNHSQRLEVRPDVGGGSPLEGPHEEEQGLRLPESESSTAISSQGPTPSLPSPGSRWDQIRAASSKSAAQSSWETIRQSQAKAQLDDNKQLSSRDDEIRQRREEQEHFDSMLEAERSIGQSSS